MKTSSQLDCLPVHSLSLQRIVAIFAFLAASLACQAQIGMRLDTKNGTKFIRYEPVEMSLVVRNETSNTFVFSNEEGPSKGKIFLEVRSESKWEGNYVNAKVNLAQDLVLGAGEQRELTGIILNSLYNLEKEGSYTVTAVLTHARLKHNLKSRPVRIEIREGILQKSITIGLPAENINDPIKTLKVSLFVVNEEPDRMYCLRVEDEKNVYGVKRLGEYIHGDAPQLVFDGYTLHILLQVRPRLYSYISYSFKGTKMIHPTQKYYLSSNGLPPTLDRSSGYVKLINARLAIDGVDYRMQND